MGWMKYTHPMPTQRDIGGFFGLELPEFGNFPQGDGVAVGSGRQALEYILRRKGNVRRVYAPYYTCPTVLEPLKTLGVEAVRYRINERLEPEEWPALEGGELFLYTNYFGIKEDCVDTLARYYGSSLIVDNALALYSPCRPGVSALYSPRKWCGVPDGGVAVTDGVALDLPEADECAADAVFLLDYLADGVEAAADNCERNEENLHYAPLRKMNRLTHALLRGIDFQAAAQRRLDNFRYLHERLGHLNRLNIDPSAVSVPSCYPFWTAFPALRDALIDSRILFPVLWPEVLEAVPQNSTEYKLAAKLLPLPIDQRWGRDEMDRIVRAVIEFYG